MKLINSLATRFRYLYVFIIIGCSVLSFSGIILTDKDNARLSYELSGNIYSKDGFPVKDSEVLIYSDIESYPGNPSAISITEADGSFRLKAIKDQSYVLEVRGTLGAGRVFIPAVKPSGRLNIIYPVTEKIVILHTNDQHFDLNLQHEKAQKIYQARTTYNDVFLMDAGDAFVRHPSRWIVNGQLMGNPDWYGKRAMAMIHSMNELAYDIMTPGNHELAYIESYTRHALESARFPLVAANVESGSEGLPSFDHYVLFNTSTWRRIAVLGLSGVHNLNETVQTYISLRESSDIFMALTHIGFKNDTILANEFPQFDIIIGGHSHHLLEEAKLVNSVLVAQAGGCPHMVSDDNPVYLGEIVIYLVNGIINEKRGKVIKITSDETFGQKTVIKSNPLKEISFTQIPD